MSNKIISNFYNGSTPLSRETPSELSEEEEESASPTPSEKGLNRNKFSFSHFFRPISSGASTPSISSDSHPFARVSSFIGSWWGKKETPENDELETLSEVENRKRANTAVFSSHNMVSVQSPVVLGPDSLSSALSSPITQELTLPQKGSFKAGDQDRKNFVNRLMSKLEEAEKTLDPEGQTKKDIDRIFYFINGESVKDVEIVKAFLGEKAKKFLFILNQTIPNTATDLVAERIFNKAPLGTTHAELSLSNSEKGKTSVHLSKEEGSPNIHIKVESTGPSTTFLKKIEGEKGPDFELIMIDETSSPQPKLLGEGRQLIHLDLTETNATYSLECSQLFREYEVIKEQG